MIHRLLLMSSFLLLTHPSSLCAEWPQWRGPLGTGVAPDGDPPSRWSETENVSWKVAI